MDRLKSYAESEKQTLKIPKKGVIKTRCGYFWLEKNSLLRGCYQPNSRVYLEDAIAEVEAYKQLNSGVSLPVIIDIRGVVYVDSKARSYYGHKDRESTFNVSAMIVSSLVSKLMANLFIKFTRPKNKTRLFTSEDEALTWIASFKENVSMAGMTPLVSKLNKTESTHQTAVSEIWRGYDDIVRVVFNKSEKLTFEDSLDVLTKIVEISNGNKVFVIIDINNIKSIENRVKDLASSEDAVRAYRAMALVTHSPVSRAIGNFFLKLSKPSFPAKLFSSEDRAIHWMSHISEDNHLEIKDAAPKKPITRTEEFLSALLSFADKDFSVKAQLIGNNDPTDELASAINMLGEELQSQIKELTVKQTQLVQASKLASLGEMSSGIAHELNNPLQFVMGFNGRIKAALDREGDVSKEELISYVSEINEGAERMRVIIQHFREFSRLAEHSVSVVNMNAIIERSFVLLNTQLMLKSISVEMQLTPSPCLVDGDGVRLEQVFVNFITNARDALVDTLLDLKKITVRSMIKDHNVVIEFQDNGMGMTKENELRIFDPFFTTKKTGEGTGLGMSIAYGIIMEHGGEIQVSSEKDQGTTFTITLPLSPAILS